MGLDYSINFAAEAIAVIIGGAFIIMGIWLLVNVVRLIITLIKVFFF